MSLLRQFQRYALPDLTTYRRFVVDGQHVGWVKPALARRLMTFSDRFIGDDRQLAFHDALDNPTARSDAMASTLAVLREEGLVPGWRNELFPVNTGYGRPPLLVIERSAAPLFGSLAYGVNLNGFVGRGWETKVWVAQRAASKTVDPNMLDHIVGGGLPLGLTPHENLVKECEEEAGIPAALAGEAVPVGIVSLVCEAQHGLRIDIQFNFDLELPADFVPENRDGEVAGFELIPVSELLHRLRSEDSFMYDSAIVQIDFLIRHGFVGPEDPEFLQLVAGLRPSLPYEDLRATP